MRGNIVPLFYLYSSVIQINCYQPQVNGFQTFLKRTKEILPNLSDMRTVRTSLKTCVFVSNICYLVNFANLKFCKFGGKCESFQTVSFQPIFTCTLLRQDTKDDTYCQCLSEVEHLPAIGLLPTGEKNLGHMNTPAQRGERYKCSFSVQLTNYSSQLGAIAEWYKALVLFEKKDPRFDPPGNVL